MTGSPTDRLYRIVEEGLCVSCGLCQSVAGDDVVEMRKTTTGNLRPVVIGDLDDETVDRIYDTCPGTRVDGLPEALVAPDTEIDPVWGPWRRMVRAWAADPDIRHEGSTGGVLTALGQYLLSSERVGFILHAKASTVEPTFGERHLSFTDTDVIAGAGSRYGPTATLIDVNDVLDRDEPFAFIGKPCDIAALRNHARHDARVDRLVRYMLTPVCGGFMPPEGMTAFLDRQNIAPDDIKAFRYRGRGCPGPTRIETDSGATELHYLDLWGEDDSMWVLPWRCKICPDGIGEAADIAAADTWSGGSPNRKDSETDPGTNGVIARTLRGQDLLEAAARDGVLTIEGEIRPDDMSDYQPHQVRKKYNAWARHQGLGDAGQIVPHTERLRLKALSEDVPQATVAEQRAGTVQRIGIGKAREPRPG